MIKPALEKTGVRALSLRRGLCRQTSILRHPFVTIDAKGTQVEIADKILEHKADDLLPLKGNQLTLENEIEEYFCTAPA